MTTTIVKRGRGRPRDPSVAPRVLAATRGLVAERGVRGVSMGAIADLAGVGKPTIYIRWPNLPALIRAAVDELAIDDLTFALMGEAQGALELLAKATEGRFLIEAVLLPSGAEGLRS